MNLLDKVTFLLFITLITSGISFGQTEKRIEGKVTDASTGEALPGATVQIKERGIGVISDLNGEFITPRIPIENTKVTISFIGYKTKEVVLNNTLKHLTVRLSPITQTLDEVQVIAITEGKAKALFEQKNAANIKNVISSEQIEEYPDVNAAETLQRIPGITLQRDKGEGKYVQLRGTPPEYTNFNINGEQIPSPESGVRYVGLDVLASDQIEYIEVTKVLTPDMDADGIGGTVNIITKTAKSETPEISASFSGGYADLRETYNYQGQFSFAQRSNKLGFSLNANYYSNDQGADNMGFEYEKGPFFSTSSQNSGEDNYHVHYSEFQLRHYNIERKRTGLSSTLDYQFNENSKIYLRGMYNSFTDHETRRRVIYTLDDPVSESYYLYGGIERDLKDRTKIQSISTINLGGEQKVWHFRTDYEVAYSMAKESEPDRLEIAFSNPGQAIVMKFNTSDADWPKISFPDEANAINATNYNEYEFDELRKEESLTTDQNITSKLNIKYPYATNFGKGYIKFGGKARYKKKDRDIQAVVYSQYKFENVPGHTGTAPEHLLPELSDNFSESNLLNQGYTVDWTPGVSETRDFFEYYPQHFYINKTETKDNTFSEDYHAEENIYATYGMIRHDFNNFMVLGGVRFEYTDINYKGNKITKDQRGNFLSLEDSTDKRSNSFILPQLQFRYKINNSNVRAAVTKTFSRPNFEDVLPYRSEDRKKLEIGNPDLEFPTATNIDLMFENYGKQGSSFSCGVFYKKIDDYVYYYRTRGYSIDPKLGNSSLLRIEVPLNGKRAFVYGAEALTQFKFKGLPWILDDFGIYFNYTFTYSEAYINKRYSANERTQAFIIGKNLISDLYNMKDEERITLPGQAKHTLNLAFFYDSKKVYAKISANYHDNFLSSLGEDKDLDEYYASAWQLDFTTNYSITKSLKVFADIKNLTNAPLKYYLGTPDRILKQEYYSWWMRMGVRLNFN